VNGFEVANVSFLGGREAELVFYEWVDASLQQVVHDSHIPPL